MIGSFIFIPCDNIMDIKTAMTNLDQNEEQRLIKNLLENDFESHVTKLASSISARGIDVENQFYASRKIVIENYKSYLIHLAVVTATIIPFSSLVFSIPEKILVVNLHFWLASMLFFISAAISYTLCFLNLIQIERNYYLKLVFSFIESGTETLNLASDTNEKLQKSVKLIEAHDEFDSNHKMSYSDSEVNHLIDRIKLSSWFFIIGLMFFFLSMIINYFYKFIIQYF